MKKTMIFAAAAAMFMFASCQKEEVIPVQDSQAGELVFTATIDQSATKTTINTDASSENKGKVSWDVNDEISVTDNTNTAVYYIKEASDIAADGSATFTYKSGDRPSSTASSYTASYGDAITAVQTYSATAGKLPMAGVSDSGDKTKLNFTVTCGLLKLNLTASGDNAKDISRIEIVGRLAGAAKDTLFALTCSNESIASAKDFYIALPAGDYTLMKFINSKGSVCFASHVCHFFWSKTASVAYAETYSDEGRAITDAFFCGFANSMTIDAQSGLYALSNDEWTYLLSSTSSGGRGDEDSKFKNGVTVNGVANCLVIAPDGYSGTIAESYDAAAWATAEAGGLVCLPAAGSRNGSTLNAAGSGGLYWSSTPHTQKEYAMRLFFFNSSQYSGVYTSELARNAGCSVRLVY